MNELGALVSEGLGQAVLAVLPLLLAAVAAGVVAGWLAARVGLADPVAMAVLRGLAVLGTLVLTVGALTEDARTLTVDAWSRLGDVGRAER